MEDQIAQRSYLNSREFKYHSPGTFWFSIPSIKAISKDFLLEAFHLNPDKPVYSLCSI